MANFTYLVCDANSGAPIQGAAIYDTISTSCCNCLGSCTGCNGCTSGDGFSVTGNTDASGNYSADTVYTCPMAHDVLVTANGYNQTHIQAETGAIDGNAGVAQSGQNAIYLVANQYVPQSNQGTAGQAQANLGSSSASASSLSTTDLIILGVVGAVLLVVVLLVVK